MKKTNLFSTLLLATAIFAGCDKADEKTTSAITVKNEQDLTQTIFADNEQGKVINITAISAWSSTINAATAITTNAQKQAPATKPDWIYINPESGGAGTYAIEIFTEINTTGADRTAIITISANNNEEIKITITQKSITEEGTVPAAPSIYGTWKLQKTEDGYFDAQGKEIIERSENYDLVLVLRENGTCTYGRDNTVFKYDNGTLALSWEDDYDWKLDVAKLTASELILFDKGVEDGITTFEKMTFKRN